MFAFICSVWSSWSLYKWSSACTCTTLSSCSAHALFAIFHSGLIGGLLIVSGHIFRLLLAACPAERERASGWGKIMRPALLLCDYVYFYAFMNFFAPCPPSFFLWIRFTLSNGCTLQIQNCSVVSFCCYLDFHCGYTGERLHQEFPNKTKKKGKTPKQNLLFSVWLIANFFFFFLSIAYLSLEKEKQ